MFPLEREPASLRLFVFLFLKRFSRSRRRRTMVLLRMYASLLTIKIVMKGTLINEKRENTYY